MFYIRADGNRQIAMGHIMRCLTIAEALKRLGEKILFITADENPVNLIKARGFAVEVLHTRYDDMEAELSKLERVLTEGGELDGETAENRAGSGDRTAGKPKILVDSYFVTPRYLEKLRCFSQVILMDDEKKAVFPCDGLVNYSIYGKTLGYEQDYPGETALFLGLEYMPLGEQFRDCAYEVRDVVEDILFTTGGGDGFHAALHMAQRLVRKKAADAERGDDEDPDRQIGGGQREREFTGSSKTPTWHIVCGPYHPDKEALERLADRYPFLRVHKNVTHMSRLMQTCDVAVSAAGSTLYELCSVGVPTVGFYFVENQRLNMETFGRATCVKNAGDFSEEPERVLDFIEKEVEVLCRERTLREKISRNMKTIVDGRGADRLAQGLCAL